MNDQTQLAEDILTTLTGIQEQSVNNEVNMTHTASQEIKKPKVYPYTKSKTKKDDVAFISLPTVLQTDLEQSFVELPNMDVFGNDKASADWLDAAQAAASLYTFKYKDKTQYESSLNRENSNWVQSLDVNNKEYRGFKTKPPGTDVTGKLSGDLIAIHLHRHLGTGITKCIPLWHSGYWVTLKTPEDIELVELFRVISEEKIKLGLKTYGLTFSSQSSIITDRICDLIFDSIFECSVNFKDNPDIKDLRDLRKITLVHDLPLLINGFFQTLYPEGYAYSRACGVNPNECRHLIEETLIFDGLERIDTSVLTEWQATHMTFSRKNSRTVDEVLRYQEELKTCRPSTIRFNENTPKEIALELEVPTIDKFLTMSNSWINGMVELLNTALGLDASSKERNEYVEKCSKCTNLRQYAHFVKSIDFGNISLDTEEAIIKALNTLSNNDEFRNQYYPAILDYIDKSVIALIGIPTYECPNCKQTEENTQHSKAFNNIIPLNMLQLFYTLLNLRVLAVEVR